MAIHIDGDLESRLRDALECRAKLLSDAAAGKANPDWLDRLGDASNNIAIILKVAVSRQEGGS